MRMRAARQIGSGALCAVLLALAAPAHGAAPEPDFVFFPHQSGSPPPPDLQDPCGIAVQPSGNLLVSNYYRHSVEAYGPPSFLGTRLANVDPLDGPCGLSLDSTGRLYVNNYHRNVSRFTLSGGPFESPTVIDSSHPTGVAVDPLTDDVYVNARTHLLAYDASGAPLLDGGEPLQIGAGSLGDGYGLAISRYFLTLGRIYIPDHSDDTVKVYDPAVDLEDPVQTISGPPGGFGSLRDSAVAVDWFTGEVYVADTLAHPQYTERPEAAIHVFDHTGAHKGRLKYNIVDGSPPGLAVDNTEDEEVEVEGLPGPNQGRVYVTSGNTIEAGVYAYPPNAETSDGAPASFSLALGTGGSGGGPIAAGLAGPPAPASSAGAPRSAPATRDGASSSVIAQKGNLRVAVSGRLAPRRLPRKGAAPISVSVGGEIATTDKTLPPRLKSLRIELNRNGRMDSSGLPTCVYDRIQPGSSSRALSSCRPALVGSGSFTADITLAGQEPYPTKGKLLVFNGVQAGKPVLFGHIYAPRPFSTSFVIVFAVQKLGKGVYGTALNAPLPAAMDAWGRLTSLEMTLSRRYAHRGERRSFLSAGCPAPKGFPGATFPLARTSFAFEGGRKLSSVLSSSCRARG